MESYSAPITHEPEISLPQLCYDIAYFILPHYAYEGVAKLRDLCLKTPSAAGPFFYIMAAQMRKMEPIIEDAKRFRWHHGELDPRQEYFVLQYPAPPPVDMSHMSPAEIVSGPAVPVLAPFFSAIVLDSKSSQSHYYILGQAPIGGGTTLRSVTRDGMNCNLGPGPEPELAAFLDSFRDRLTT